MSRVRKVERERLLRERNLIQQKIDALKSTRNPLLCLPNLQPFSKPSDKSLCHDLTESHAPITSSKIDESIQTIEIIDTQPRPIPNPPENELQKTIEKIRQTKLEYQTQGSKDPNIMQELEYLEKEALMISNAKQEPSQFEQSPHHESMTIGQMELFESDFELISLKLEHRKNMLKINQEKEWIEAKVQLAKTRKEFGPFDPFVDAMESFPKKVYQNLFLGIIKTRNKFIC